MPFEYLSVDEAIARRGMAHGRGRRHPEPVGRGRQGHPAHQGHRLDRGRLVDDSEPLKEWAGQRSGPVAIYDDEKPRAGWAEILLLAERLAPTPALLPEDAAERALAFGLAHEICGEDGLGWARRLQLIHAGLQGAGGFPPRIAAYLAKKYGHSPETGNAASARVVALLGMLAARLKAQKAAGSHYESATP